MNVNDLFDKSKFRNDVTGDAWTEWTR